MFSPVRFGRTEFDEYGLALTKFWVSVSGPVWVCWLNTCPVRSLRHDRRALEQVRMPAQMGRLQVGDDCCRPAVSEG